jgi:hypothetical protein
LVQWFPLTNNNGDPLNITTPHGSMQWLRMTAPPGNQSSFIRLSR